MAWISVKNLKDKNLKVTGQLRRWEQLFFCIIFEQMHRFVNRKGKRFQFPSTRKHKL